SFVEQLLSEESLRKTGYFDPAAVRHWRQAYRTLRAHSPQRASVEMGLVGVIATQLWYHTFIDGSLSDLPTKAPTKALTADLNGYADLPAPHRSSSLAAHPFPGRGA